MRKCVSIIITALILISCHSMLIYAEEDYSYLDDMTINQLKALDAEIHKRIPNYNGVISVFGASNTANNDETKDGIRQDEEYVKMFDNKYMTVYAKRFEDKTMIKNSKPPFYKLGFKLHIINKTSDKYLTLGISSISFGKKTLGSHFYGCGYAAPKSELYTEIVFNRIVSDDEKSAFLDSYEDMVDIKGIAQIYYNKDGSLSGTGLEKASFKMY